MQKITGEAIALVSKYTHFDPAHPEKTEAADFALINRSCLNKDGDLNRSWSKDGYIMVGTAAIEITLFPKKEVTNRAVASLRKQQKHVLATAQAEATRIEGQIQSLLAIEHVG